MNNQTSEQLNEQREAAEQAAIEKRRARSKKRNLRGSLRLLIMSHTQH